VRGSATRNIQIHHFKTTFHILNTLPKYKYITSKQHSCVQGPLRVCCSIRSGASGLPYYCTSPLAVLNVLGEIAVSRWRQNNKNKKQKTKRTKLQSIHTVTGKGGIGGADQWVLVKAKGIPKGYHRELNHARILEYPLSVFNKHSTLTNTPA